MFVNHYDISKPRLKHFVPIDDSWDFQKEFQWGYLFTRHYVVLRSKPVKAKPRGTNCLKLT